MIVWKGHTKRVRCLAFAPDGRRLASAADQAAAVSLWDPAAGTLDRKLAGLGGFTWGVAFSPDGRLLATLSDRSMLVVHDAATFEPVAAMREGNARYGLTFAADGRTVAAAGWHGVLAWDDPGRPDPGSLAPYPTESRPPDRRYIHLDPAWGLDFHKWDSVAFSPDGRLLAAAGERAAAVWDAGTGGLVASFDHPPTPNLTAVGFSPDGRWLAVGRERTADVWPIGGGGPVRLGKQPGVVRAVRFHPDGRTLMTAGGDGTVRFWDYESVTERRAFDWGIGRVYAAVFAPDGPTAAAGGEDGRIVVWDVDG